MTTAGTTRRGRPLIHRFDRAERALHWLLALDIVVLTLSGLGLYLGPGTNPVLDRRETVRTVHIDAAVLLLVLPVVIAALRPGLLRGLWRDVEWFDADDRRWLLRVAIPARLRRRPLPAQGRFNAGQKLNTIITAAALVGFTVTGALMDIGGSLPASLSEAADDTHLWLMWLGAPLVLGHVLLAVAVPSTRPAMRAIVTGRIRLDVARRRHARWVEETGGQPPRAGG